MKNYMYKWELENRGFEELPKEEFTESQLDMEKFILSISEVIKEAKCGWTGVRFVPMKHKEYGIIEEYMVLYVDGGGDRWIPVTANSKGCNFSVLGENLW